MPFATLWEKALDDLAEFLQFVPCCGFRHIDLILELSGYRACMWSAGLKFNETANFYKNQPLALVEHA
jgi:hypothetical protein